VNNHPCILNFDHSLIRQKDLLAEFSPLIIDLGDLAPRVRLWAGKPAAQEIKSVLSECINNPVKLFGSGDFHHISSLLISRYRDPISVIVFDHHPDWDLLPPRLGCGSWINRILELNNVSKVVLVGASSRDISTSGIQTANLGALRDNRLEIFPYAHEPSKAFFRDVPENFSIAQRKAIFFTEISWRELKGRNFSRLISQVVERLPTQKVYLSIDKDCLRNDYALTNWEEGFLNLDQLLGALRLIKKEKEIIGTDICGDYSYPFCAGRIKKIASSLDHPRYYSARGKSPRDIDSINQATNISILETLLS